MSKLSGRELYISTTTTYIHGKIMLSGRGYISTPPPHVLKLSGGGYIDNDDIYTRENNVIGEGVYRPPPLVLKLSGGGISTTTYPIKNKKTKKK